MKMNNNQQKAVDFNEGALLVVAGAGTGKTRVITERIKRIIESGVSPKEIAALTFTEKASQEMLERLGDAMPLGYEEPWVYTFHRFSDRILRNEGIEIGIDPSYKIISYPEQWILLRKNLFKFKLDYFRPLGNPTKFISAILKFISRLQDENITTERFNKFSEEFRGEMEEKQRWKELAHLYEKYQELKISQSKMDFGDLIQWNIKLFKERPNILKKYQEQFKHLLIDEFQDTNYAQYELIKMICPENKIKDRSLMVVGDDSQSIYKFRGAAVSNILQFMEDYKQAEMITLIENYRSTQSILDASYNLIQNNNPDSLESKLGISKKLISKREESNETKNSKIKNKTEPEILYLETAEDEVEQIMLKIVEVLENNPNYTYKDIAILARANSHLEPLVLALRKYELPYQLVGNRGLYDRNEIRDILAMLKIIINPYDNIAMYRMLSIKAFDISHDVAVDILAKAKIKKTNLWDVIKEMNIESLNKLKEVIAKSQEKILKYQPHELTFEMVKNTGYLEAYLEEETIESQMCIRNMNIFLEKIKRFEKEHYEDTKEIPTIIDLLNYLELMIESGDNPAQAEIEDIDTINLMTVHASKGLEYEVVFVVSVTSDRFPTKNRKDVIMLPEELISETLPTGDEHIQEERRLFYVALTRAKKYLYITLAKNYGGKRDKKPSGFIQETDIKIKEIETPKKEVEEKQHEDQVALFGKESGFRDTKKQTETKSIDLGNISYSKITKYETCPLSFKYAYVLNIPTPDNASLSFGIAIHETLFDYHSKKSMGKNISLEDLLNVYKNKWIPLGYLEQEHEKLRFESGEKLLTEYFNKHKDENIKHLGLEKWFNIKIGKEKFIGKIDRIDKLPSGGVEIVDYKTGSAKEQGDIDKDEQLAFYTIGAQEALGLKVEKLSYYYLEDGIKLSTTRTQEQLEKTREKTEEVVNEMKKGKFEPKSGMHCMWCDYRDICPAAYKG